MEAREHINLIPSSPITFDAIGARGSNFRRNALYRSVPKESPVARAYPPGVSPQSKPSEEVL